MRVRLAEVKPIAENLLNLEPGEEPGFLFSISASSDSIFSVSPGCASVARSFPVSLNFWS